jgi:hypothetical protein
VKRVAYIVFLSFLVCVSQWFCAMHDDDKNDVDVSFIQEICTCSPETLSKRYYLSELYRLHYAVQCVEQCVEYQNCSTIRRKADKARSLIQASMGECFIGRM